MALSNKMFFMDSIWDDNDIKFSSYESLLDANERYSFGNLRKWFDDNIHKEIDKSERKVLCLRDRKKDDLFCVVQMSLLEAALLVGAEKFLEKLLEEDIKDNEGALFKDESTENKINITCFGVDDVGERYIKEQIIFLDGISVFDILVFNESISKNIKTKIKNRLIDLSKDDKYESLCFRSLDNSMYSIGSIQRLVALFHKKLDRISEHTTPHYSINAVMKLLLPENEYNNLIKEKHKNIIRDLRECDEKAFLWMRTVMKHTSVLNFADKSNRNLFAGIVSAFSDNDKLLIELLNSTVCYAIPMDNEKDEYLEQIEALIKKVQSVYGRNEILKSSVDAFVVKCLVNEADFDICDIRKIKGLLGHRLVLDMNDSQIENIMSKAFDNFILTDGFEQLLTQKIKRAKKFFSLIDEVHYSKPVKKYINRVICLDDLYLTEMAIRCGFIIKNHYDYAIEESLKKGFTKQLPALIAYREAMKNGN